jgi:hypothetical protein
MVPETRNLTPSVRLRDTARLTSNSHPHNSRKAAKEVTLKEPWPDNPLFDLEMLKHDGKEGGKLIRYGARLQMLEN